MKSFSQVALLMSVVCFGAAASEAFAQKHVDCAEISFCASKANGKCKKIKVCNAPAGCSCTDLIDPDTAKNSCPCAK